MDQQFKYYKGNTAWLGIIIVKTRLTMSNWSSEAVNQRRDNIITKGKNEPTIYRTRGKHANHYTTNVVKFILKESYLPGQYSYTLNTFPDNTYTYILYGSESE
jgi:hypothetical protein